MHVVVITAGLSRGAAGIYEAVRGQVISLARYCGVRVSVLGLVSEPKRWPRDRLAWETPGVNVEAVPGEGVNGLVALLNAARRRTYSSVDLVHVHGQWNGPTLAGADLAGRYSCPLAISPHGMLEPWALRYHASRKRLPWLLWERGIIGSAGLLQAMSWAEVDGFRRCGFRNPAVVLPIGLDWRGIPGSSNREEAEEKTCLFLSRIHPKKGLPLLINAWGSLRPKGWKLVIAGPDECGYSGILQRKLGQLDLAEVVTVRGPLYGDDKREALGSSHLFVLPSYSENFGIVVAEAMAAGLPVLTTTATPWRILQDEGMGWWVPPTETAVFTALNEATTISESRRQQMGAAAAAYAHEAFQWAKIARQLHEAYRWLIDEPGARPWIAFNGTDGNPL